MARINLKFNAAGICLLACLGAQSAAAEFVDEFDTAGMSHDSSGRDGWTHMTGDGNVTMAFSRHDGIGRVIVDAREDRHNTWWAFIRRSVSEHIDVKELARPDRELRVEARVRASTAPRRINLHFNHSRTTDFHSHLMEFDLPDTDNWHEISMTTDGFDAVTGDEVFVQLALIDWGRSSYHLDIDYLRVGVVDPRRAGPDRGPPIPYRPPLPPAKEFRDAVIVAAAEDATVDSAWPDANLANWSNRSQPGCRPLLAVGSTQTALMRWDLSEFEHREALGWGIVELTTDQVYRADTELEELGQLRVVEILGGDVAWTRESVTYNSLLAGQDASAVFNEQMLVDVPPATQSGARTRIGVSPVVLQRLLSGRTKGLAVHALGAMSATFCSGAGPTPHAGPVLYFNLEEPEEESKEIEE